MFPSGEAVNLLEYPVGDAVRRGVLIGHDEPDQPRMAEEFHRGALRVSDLARMNLTIMGNRKSNKRP